MKLIIANIFLYIGKAIEYMVGDALNAANGVMKITDKLTDAKKYSTLTDTILKQIEVSEDQVRVIERLFLSSIAKKINVS